MISNGSATLPFSTSSSSDGSLRLIASPTSLRLSRRPRACRAARRRSSPARRAVRASPGWPVRRADRDVGRGTGDAEHRVGPRANLLGDADERRAQPAGSGARAPRAGAMRVAIEPAARLPVLRVTILGLLDRCPRSRPRAGNTRASVLAYLTPAEPLHSAIVSLAIVGSRARRRPPHFAALRQRAHNGCDTPTAMVIPIRYLRCGTSQGADGSDPVRMQFDASVSR